MKLRKKHRGWERRDETRQKRGEKQREPHLNASLEYDSCLQMFTSSKWREIGKANFQCLAPNFLRTRYKIDAQTASVRCF